MSLRKISQRFLRPHLLIPFELQCSCHRKYCVKLYPMGKFQEPNEKSDAYMPGQMFFHKVFAYRGVVLQSWQARVYDNDEKDRTGRTLRSKRKTQLYYQVLVDKTDSQYIRAENLSMSFLPLEYGNINNNRNGIQAQPNSIPGVDYVSHQDMMPYQVTKDAKPIKHELFDKFFTQVPGFSDSIKQYEEKDTLKSFQESNHPWLSLSDVFKETTENIRVTVIPFYIGKQETFSKYCEIFSKYWWRYCIRIENLGEETVQLRDRNWKIFCNNNSVETLQGRGVIGKEPRLTKESPAFQYNSHVSLDYPSGYMWGLFTFEREDGSKIEVKIPPFNLQRGDVKLHDPNDDIIG